MNTEARDVATGETEAEGLNWRYFWFCLPAVGVVVAAIWFLEYLLGQEWQSWWGWVWRYLCTFVFTLAIGWGPEWRERRKRAAKADASAPGQ